MRGKHGIEDIAGAERLKIEIVRQATDDYRKAIREGDLKTLKDCRDFFCGEWFVALFDFDGRLFMQRIRPQRTNKYLVKTCAEVMRVRRNYERL